MKPHFLYGSLLAIVIISLFIPSNAQISSSGGSIRSNFNPSELEKYFGAGDVIRKIPLSPNNRTVGIEWVRDTLYVLSQPLNITLPAVLQKIDPIDGTIISQFSLPFAGFVLGITFDGKDLWIVKWNPNPEIYQIGTTGNLISSFPAPDAVVRGIAWDGQYLWVGEALNQIFYQVDTLGNVIKSVSWTNAPVWPMGLVWVTEHSAGHLWTNVDINDQIFQLNVDDTLSIIQNFTTPSPSLPEGICYDGEFLWVADFDTDTLWQVDDGIISSVENNENDNTLSFNLNQNYPNPFNPSTKISWQAPVGSWQTLKVFDVLGNEVAILVDEYKPAGSYEVEFNISSISGSVSAKGGYASGVYLFQLKTEGYIETKKMMLIK